MILICLLFFLAAFNGMILGLLISILSRSYLTAFIVSQSYMMPFLLISGKKNYNYENLKIFFSPLGIIWPFEGMPIYLQYFSRFFPIYYPIQTLRNLIFKGRSICETEVYFGFIVLIIWTVIASTLCFVFIRNKKSENKKNYQVTKL